MVRKTSENDPGFKLFCSRCNNNNDEKIYKLSLKVSLFYLPIRNILVVSILID